MLVLVCVILHASYCTSYSLLASYCNVLPYPTVHTGSVANSLVALYTGKAPMIFLSSVNFARALAWHFEGLASPGPPMADIAGLGACSRG